MRLRVESGQHTARSRNGRRAAGQLESDVLSALWAGDGPMSPAEVLEAIGSDVAYVTVLSTLIRLRERGTVDRDKHGRAHLYRPVRSRAETAAIDMRAMLDGGGDHEQVLTRFLDMLPATDQETVRSLVRRRKSPPR